MISVGIVKEDNTSYYAFSSEYDYYLSNQWVRDNVITSLYNEETNEEQKNEMNVQTFHKYLGKTNDIIAKEIQEFVGEDPIFYGYYADYDWVKSKIKR